MNLNTTLCKYVDVDKKGYVTFGDVVIFTLYYGVIVAVLSGLVYSFYQGYLLIVSGRVFDDVTGLNDILGHCGIAIMIFILCVLFFTVIVLIVVAIAHVFAIKIAKCEYKKDDE